MPKWPTAGPTTWNCANGLVDLQTGWLYPHDPRAMMTYCLDVDYNPAAVCPRFWAMHRRACGDSDRWLTTSGGCSGTA